MPRGRPKGVTSAAVHDRRMKTLNLRREGYTLAAIAEALEVTMGAITADVKWLRSEGYDLGEGHTGKVLPPPGAEVAQLRVVAAADDEAVVRREVNDRRIAGESILMISIAMQITAHDVRRHIHEAHRLAQGEDIEARRELQLSRCEELLRGLRSGILEGNPKSVNAAVRVIAEMNRLQGLYRPIQVEHTMITVDMIDHEVARLTTELARLEGGLPQGYLEGEAVEE